MSALLAKQPYSTTSACTNAAELMQVRGGVRGSNSVVANDSVLTCLSGGEHALQLCQYSCLLPDPWGRPRKIWNDIVLSDLQQMNINCLHHDAQNKPAWQFWATHT